MTLIVEDGSIVPNANSFVSDAEYVEYASARGLTIGADAAARETELIRAMDYLEYYRDEYKGLKVERDQPLQWPRYSVWVDSFQLDSNVIPKEIKRAQMEAGVLIASGVSLTPSGNIENVQSQSIGDLSISYFSGGTYKTVQHKNIDQHLEILLQNQGDFRSRRV